MAKVRVTMAKSDFVLLPDGKYEGWFSEPEIKEGTKAPYLNVKFNTDYPGDDGEIKTKVVYCMFSHSPKAVWRLQKVLEAIGVEFEVEEVELEDGSKVEALVYDPDDIAGKSCIAEIHTEEYNKKLQNKVKDVYAPI